MARRAPRLSLACYAGAVRCFFTICTADRRPYFANLALGSTVLAELRHVSAATDIAVLAYCLMPDHAHLLLEGRSRLSEPLACVTRWKQRTAYHFRRAMGRRLWQEGYYDRILRPHEESIDVAAYVLNNPIRAALADCLGEYALSGSDIYTAAELTEALQSRVPWRWRRPIGPTVG